MSFTSNLEEHCYRILEENGGKIADRARMMFFEENSLEWIQQPLQYISENWSDLFTPSMIILSCEAVGGKPNCTTNQAALAMTLMNLSFYLWDDILDKIKYKRFKPTVPHKFGEGVTLMIGGLASAKAFSILNKMKVNEKKRQTITNLIWNYWKKLAKAEAKNLELRDLNDIKPEEKLKVIEMEGIGVETLMKIGAMLGNGSEEEIKHLGKYGRFLSIILELKKDFIVSINLTLELAEKIRSGALPYTLLWAKNRSKKIGEYLQFFPNTTKPINIKKIVEEVLETKALENSLRTLKKLTQKAETELVELKINKATSTLKFFLEAQYKIFIESLSIYE